MACLEGNFIISRFYYTRLPVMQKEFFWNPVIRPWFPTHPAISQFRTMLPNINTGRAEAQPRLQVVINCCWTDHISHKPAGKRGLCSVGCPFLPSRYSPQRRFFSSHILRHRLTGSAYKVHKLKPTLIPEYFYPRYRLRCLVFEGRFQNRVVSIEFKQKSPRM